MKIAHLLAAASLAALAACAPPQPPAAEAPATPVEAPLELKAPAGVYNLDKNHASLVFRVKHLGLSNYTARFTDLDATLNFDPANPAAMSVTATVNPASIKTDFPGDFKGTHPQSKFKTWDEELARNPDWLASDANKEITFKSTSVETTGARTAKVTGDLTFRGVTAPVTLDVTFNGELSPHPFLNGRSAVGFSAVGTLSRGAFGVTNLADFIGDDVSFVIETEFHQQASS